MLWTSAVLESGCVNLNASYNGLRGCACRLRAGYKRFPCAGKTSIMHIDIKFPFVVQLMNMKRPMTRIAGKKAKLLLDFILNGFWKIAIGLTKSLGKIEDYSSSHRSASDKVLNRRTRPATTSRLELRIASCVSGRS